jgi:hypothetical protein
VEGELKNYFRPEFLNRIDEVVVFHSLDAKNIESIARIQLKVLMARLQKMDLTMEVSEAAIAELAKVGFDPVFGARPLKRAIQQRIENPLSKLLLEGRFPPKSTIPVDVDPIRDPGVFRFEKTVSQLSQAQALLDLIAACAEKACSLNRLFYESNQACWVAGCSTPGKIPEPVDSIGLHVKRVRAVADHAGNQLGRDGRQGSVPHARVQKRKTHFCSGVSARSPAMNPVSRGETPSIRAERFAR